MAGRTAYSDSDKAMVYAVLTSNSGNIKRTARDTHFPETTVRRWKEEFKTNPPSLELVESEVDSFLKEAREVRRLALQEIKRQIGEGKAKVGELNAVVGTLTDKEHAIRGIATQRTEHKLTLPSADELRDVLGAAIGIAITQSNSRQEEIIDAEIVEEQRALPKP